MKRLKTCSLNLRNSVVALGIGSASVATAVERPADLDEKTPQHVEIPLAPERPAQAQNAEVMPQVGGEAADHVPYLGVGSVAIDEVLAEHLGLDHGVVVRQVHEGSGAFKAGLQPKDILLSFAGRELRSPLDLRDAVSKCAVGDEIELSLLRKGKEEKQAVVLAERPLGLPGIGPRGRMQQFWPGAEGMPAADAFEQIEQLRGMLDEQFNGARLGLKLNDIFKGNFADEDGNMGFEFNAESSVTWADNEGDITMKMKDGQSEVKVRDREGKIVFEGPWDTPQDKAAVDPEIRRRIENMGVERQGNQFKFRMEGLPQGR